MASVAIKGLHMGALVYLAPVIPPTGGDLFCLCGSLRVLCTIVCLNAFLKRAGSLGLIGQSPISLFGVFVMEKGNKVLPLRTSSPADAPYIYIYIMPRRRRLKPPEVDHGGRLKPPEVYIGWRLP